MQTSRIIRNLTISLIVAASTVPVTVSADKYNVFDEYGLFQKLIGNEKRRYHSLQYIFNDYQKKQYLSIDHPRDRAEWLDRFWLILDPTPTTLHNERKEEHESRTELALKLFPKKDPPGWDDRGEVLIRFGMPDSRERIWSHIGRFEQKMPGEIWRYDSPLMLVTFTDHYLNGEYHWNYTPKGEESWTDFYRESGFGKSSRMTMEENEGKYRQDSYIVVPNTLPTHIDPHMTDAINMFNPDMLDYIAGNNMRNMLFPALKEHIEDDYRRADKALTGFHTNMTRERFLHYPDLDLSMAAFFDICCFDAGNGMIRTEINFDVPFEELEIIQNDDGISAGVELRVLARDIDMREIASRNEHVAFHAPASGKVMVPRFLPGQIVLTLEPGYYRFGIETVDPASGRRGVFCSSHHIEAKTPDLCISDVMFAKQITSDEKPNRYMKGNLTIIPHPLHLYRRPYPLIFYFEIYGLTTDKDDFTFYSLDYSIEPLKKKRTGLVLEEIKTVMSSGFETSGYGSTQPQRLEIATDDLWEGAFRLKIRVMDRRTRRVVSRTANFSILE